MDKKVVTKPSFVPTDEERKEVTKMSAVGIPQESICRVIRGGIDDKTLRKHFREELDTAATKANTGVAGTLYNQAMAGNVTAAIWWSKTRMGWKETSVTELQGKDGTELNLWGKPTE